MRAFVAMNLGDAQTNAIGRWYPYIKSQSYGLKLVDLKNLHLTLKFLGEINYQQETVIQRIFKSIAEKHTYMTLTIDHWGSFKRKEGDILWLGIKGDLVNLHEIVDELQLQLKVGQPETSTSFKPHITIARKVKFINNIKSWELFTPISWYVTELSLMQSVFNGGSVSYKPRFVVNLRK